MKTNNIIAAFLAALVLPASAVVNIDYVTVGDAGNATDPATGSLYGAVAYAYKIAKNETTISQYAEFLNAVAKTDTYGLYSTNMTFFSINGISRSGSSGTFTYSVAAGSGNKPITYVSWFDAARFCNWLQNGQPTTGTQTVGTTEDGAYTLNGATLGTFNRNVGATVWIPTRDEWYKAAYYDPTKNAGLGGYWQYATQSNSLTSNTIGVTGAANFFDGDTARVQNGLPGALTDVGAYGVNSASYYGTNDQTGNVKEWNDFDGTHKETRGGSYGSSAPVAASSYYNYDISPNENSELGFRLASIPEPSSLILSLLASGAILTRRSRRA
jgi:formylglycine-generating enzyme